MSFELIGKLLPVIQKQAIAEIENCNQFTSQFGLSLTHNQAVQLAETRSNALNSNGRVEFGGGTVSLLIEKFYDSPYINSQNYAETLNELINIFYYYKNETLDILTDEELLDYMKYNFNESCCGSVKVLADREMERLAHNIRFGYSPDYQELAEKNVSKTAEEEDFDE